jgi:hypothetical protein
MLTWVVFQRGLAVRGLNLSVRRVALDVQREVGVDVRRRFGGDTLAAGCRLIDSRLGGCGLNSDGLNGRGG